MSWHTNAVLIHHDFSDDYAALFTTLGLEGATPGAIVPFDDATSPANEGVAAGTADGWTALWGNLAMYMIDDKRLARIAKKAAVFQMVLEGVSDTAGFTWYSGGKKVRDWMRQGGKVVKDKGKPLPQEQKAFAKKDDEQAVLQILQRLTLPLKKLQAIPYQLYDFPDDVLFAE